MTSFVRKSAPMVALYWLLNLLLTYLYCGYWGGGIPKRGVQMRRRPVPRKVSTVPFTQSERGAPWAAWTEPPVRVRVRMRMRVRGAGAGSRWARSC